MIVPKKKNLSFIEEMMNNPVLNTIVNHEMKERQRFAHS